MILNSILNKLILSIIEKQLFNYYHSKVVKKYV